MLSGADILAIIVANAPLNAGYQDLIHAHLLGRPIHHWINPALMAVFFLLVGFEIKHELMKARARRGTAGHPGSAGRAGVGPDLAFRIADTTASARGPGARRGWGGG